MQTLQTITYVIVCTTLFATTFFVVSAFYRLHNLQKEIDRIMQASHLMLGMTFRNYVQGNFDALQKMRDAIKGLIESENYEEAEKLRKQIILVEEICNRSRRKLEEIFGDDIIEVVITKSPTAEEE